ncbi:MAG: prepilin peptidase [Lachnospiraceae bacterium]|nr:prepilin peptidase [Lachnospiraceae bacterium]
MRAATVLFAAVWGLLFGSFLNCTAMRIVRGEDWVRARSRCPKCGHTLGAEELIPVISFLFLRGKCRSCGEKISLRYPVTEIVFGVLCALMMLRFGISVMLLRSFVFACCLFVLTLTDIEARLIPNGCLLIALVTWFVTLPWLFAGWRDFGTHIVAMIGFSVAILCLSLIMDLILKKDSLGGGDVKLIAVIALYLGVIGTMFMLIIASLLGIGFAVVNGKFRRGTAIAFGPFLSAAGLLMALYGEPLVAWYVSFL